MEEMGERRNPAEGRQLVKFPTTRHSSEPGFGRAPARRGRLLTAFVEVRLVAEAQLRVPRLELLRGLEDLAGKWSGGHTPNRGADDPRARCSLPAGRRGAAQPG